MKPTVLVTGASGFVGRAVVSAIADQGTHIIRAASRRPQLHSAPEVKAVVGPELGPNADWSEPLRDVDAVIHLAAMVHVMRTKDPAISARFDEVNHQGTARLATQAAEAGVRRLIFMSSIKVHGEHGHFNEDCPLKPLDPYGESKMAAEDALWRISRSTGLEVVVLRPPLVYGPGVGANFLALLSAVRKGVPLPLGAVHNARSFVAVGNLASAVYTCLHHTAAAGQAFLVSDGNDLSTPDLVRRLAATSNCTARLLPVPAAALNVIGKVLGHGPAVSRLTTSLTVDIGKARRLLGWVPPLTVEEGLRRLTDVSGEGPATPR